jgi:FAD synthetase
MDCLTWPAEPASYVKDAVAVLEQALRLWPQGELALAFNGGKDCTVLLGLVLLAEAKRLGRTEAGGTGLTAEETTSFFSSGIKMVYFVEEGCFPQQDAFIVEAQKRFGFELVRVGANLKENTATLVAEHGVRAFVMGTRRTDPYAGAMAVGILCAELLSSSCSCGGDTLP